VLKLRHHKQNGPHRDQRPRVRQQLRRRRHLPRVKGGDCILHAQEERVSHRSGAGDCRRNLGLGGIVLVAGAGEGVVDLKEMGSEGEGERGGKEDKRVSHRSGAGDCRCNLGVFIAGARQRIVALREGEGRRNSEQSCPMRDNESGGYPGRRERGKIPRRRLPLQSWPWGNRIHRRSQPGGRSPKREKGEGGGR
jgi:hypothetical protein